MPNESYQRVGPAGPRSTQHGADLYYSDEEREFMVALDRYKRENLRNYPTCSEVLHVLKTLGYTKGPSC